MLPQRTPLLVGAVPKIAYWSGLLFGGHEKYPRQSAQKATGQTQGPGRRRFHETQVAVERIHRSGITARRLLV